MEQREIYVKSTLDGSLQPSLFYKSDMGEGRPLLVGLHSWSLDRFNQIDDMLPQAEKYGFNLLLPEFRGGNLSTNEECTKACASEFAMQDIKDAIDYVIENEGVDRDNIFLLGSSGGGHMTLMMASFCPEVFRVMAAFVPISNLIKWAEYSDHYREHILACCSGDEEEMKKRSPFFNIDNIAKANLKIFHGKYDIVVPVTQSIELYNELMKKYPESRVFLDVFDGGHQMDMHQAMYWILSQYDGSDKVNVTG